jgi:dipeptidyl aminopeptidase/acylaminoacyl peptidase
MTTSPQVIGNPYVGPRTFTEAQGRLFFGREREARDLLARVLSERLVLFYAQSGAGKSSLIKARLIPQLREVGYAVLPVARVGGELPAGMKAADNVYACNLMTSLDTSQGDPNRFAQLSLSQFLAGLASEDGEHFTYRGADPPAAEKLAGVSGPAMPYVLVIDQFEEIITAHPGRWREREDFFRQLNQAMLDDPNLWVVLALREDYVAALDPYAPLLADRLRARFYMERMGVDAALNAIREPTRLGGRPFAPGVAEKLTDDLRQVRVPGQEGPVPGQYVEPVQLQVVCYQLWENIKGRPAGPITAQDLAEAGDVNQALSRFYEQTLQEVLANPAASGVTERQLRTWFDKELINEAGTRDLVRQGAETTGSLPNAIVSQLQQRFLVHAEARSGDTWIELVHDRFVEPIRASNAAWFPVHLSALQRQAALWNEQGRSDGLLLTGDALGDAERWAQAHEVGLGQHERDFLVACRAARKRMERERRQSRWILILAVAAVFISILAIGALLRTRAAQATARVFEQQAALAQADATRTQHQVATAQADATRAQHQVATAQADAIRAQHQVATAQADARAAVEQAQNSLAVTEANLEAALTAQAPPAVPAIPTSEATGTRRATVTPAGNQTPSRTPILRIATPNVTAVAQQMQLAQVRATQTALAESLIVTLTPTRQPIIWPPAGRIVFVSNRDNSRGDLYIMRSDGEGVSRLTDTTAYEPSYTAADGGQLAYTSKPGERVSIYRRPVSGGSVVNLTGFDSDNWEPAFSSDGQRIAFVSSRDNLDWEIYVMNADGRGVNRLTKDDPARNTMPTWSPDARMIAFVTVEGCGRPPCPSAIRVMASDGTNVDRLVYFEGKVVSHPAWAPDGRQIAFAGNRDGSMDIFVVNVDGTNLRNLTNSPYDEDFPAWSLDGRWISFTRYTDNTEIFLMTADGDRVTQITNNPASDWYPVWVR